MIKSVKWRNEAQTISDENICEKVERNGSQHNTG